MNQLLDFPIPYSENYKLSKTPTDEELQDLCTNISRRMQLLLGHGETPKVSIVFPAYNEEAYLPLMLWTLSKLCTQIPVEIIGVNNASLDRTGEILDLCGVLRVDEKRKGVSYARQAGLEAAKGEIIATTDADSQVPQRWIDASMIHFNNDENLVSLLGDIKVLKMHPSQHIIRVIPRLIRFLIGNGYSPKMQGLIGGANIFFRRDIVQQIGGYTPGFNLGEDILLVEKLKSYGKVLRYMNDDTTVFTSNRRLDTITKVLGMYLENSTRVNWLNHKSLPITRPQDFPDIR